MLLAGLLLATLLSFWPVLGADFVAWDDAETVLKNPWLRAGRAERTAHFWTRPQMDLYIPVTYEAWALVASVARRAAPGGAALDPAVFHAANLAVHLLAVLLAYALLRRFFTSLPAATGALLFGLHPVQVEPVAWVSGLKDVLSGALALGALLVFPIRAPGAVSARTGAPANPTAVGGTPGRYAAATLLFALALLAKPGVMSLPALLLILAWSQGRLTRRIAPWVAPWFLIALACLWWTKNAQSPPLDPSPWFRPVIAGHALGAYLGKLAWPLQLGVDYGYSPGWLLRHPAAWAVGLIPLAIGAALFLRRRRLRWLAGGAAFFATALSPVLGLVPFDFQYYSTVADRYLYLPLFGIALMAAGAMTRLRRGPGVTLVLAALALLGARSFDQARQWRDSRTLFEHTLAVNPSSTAALTNLATIALDMGRPREAEAYARRSIAVEPNDAGALVRLASALSLQGQRAAALDWSRRAWRAMPDNPEVLLNLGIELAEQGQLPEALAHFARAVELAPDMEPARLNYGTALLQQNRLPEAQAELERAVRLDPGDAQARTNLGLALLRQGQVARARAELTTALAIDPSYAPAASALRSLPATAP